MSFNADAKKAGQRHKSSATSGALVPKAGAGDAVKANIKESTARALVLRNGKHGAMGAGELAAPARMSGREKLELLAGMSAWSLLYHRSSYVSCCRG